MDLNAQIEALIETAMKHALAPLEAEIKLLRGEIEALKGSPLLPSGSSEPETPAPASLLPPHLQEILPSPELPTDRSDFARMLARLEQDEERNYSEEKLEKAAEKPKKRGWNPFQR
jgi:hypothetical protein